MLREIGQAKICKLLELIEHEGILLHWGDLRREGIVRNGS